MDVKSVTDRAAQTLLWTELIRGLGRVLSDLLREIATINYPPEKGPLGPCFHGEHALHHHPSIMGRGEERCIMGQLCQVLCPYKAITSETHVTRRTTRYDIDKAKCS